MKKPLRDFDGIMVKVDAPESDEDILICPRFIAGLPLVMPDNVLGKCNDCGHTVQMRPKNAKLTFTTVCVHCLGDRNRGGRA